MRLPLAAFTLLLAACQPAAPPAPAAAATSQTPATLAITHPAGVTLHYRRSNQDGSEPERVLVHIVSDHEVAVAKMVAPCTSAALVTAVFDPATGDATHLVGGRLGRDGAQEAQAAIDYDAGPRRIDLRLGNLKGPASETVTVPASPWRLYDFDFAEFALFGPRDAAPKTYGYALTWPDGPAPFLRQLGEASLAFVAREGDLNRFRIEGPAFGAKGGEISFDARFGHVVDARLGAPNHGGMADYWLHLDHITPDEAAWRAELAKHWAGCPA